MRPYLIFCLALGLFSPLFTQCPPVTKAGIHMVQKGETLFGIARTYGISVSQLRQLNDLKENSSIHPCSELVVFLSGPQALSPAVATAAPATYGSSPAVMNPTTITTRSVNNTPSPVVRQNGGMHIVRQGETMTRLAKAYGYTEERFRQFNGYNSFQEPTVGTAIRSEHCNCTSFTSKSPVSNNQYSAPSTYNSVLSNEVANAFTGSPSNPVGGTPMPTTYSSTPTLPTNTSTPSNNLVVRDDRSYMTPNESAMINEINLMRSNPAAYVNYVEEFVRNYPTKFQRQIDRRYVNSLISDLRNSPRLSTLIAHPCLYQVAKGHGLYLRSVNGFSHTGAGGSSPATRTQSSCPSLQLSTSSGKAGNLIGNENLVAGYTTVREAVIGLLIDEGLHAPGHRETLLAPEWRYVAVNDFGTLGQFPNNFVQLFAR